MALCVARNPHVGRRCGERLNRTHGSGGGTRGSLSIFRDPHFGNLDPRSGPGLIQGLTGSSWMINSACFNEAYEAIGIQKYGAASARSSQKWSDSSATQPSIDLRGMLKRIIDYHRQPHGLRYAIRGWRRQFSRLPFRRCSRRTAAFAACAVVGSCAIGAVCPLLHIWSLRAFGLLNRDFLNKQRKTVRDDGDLTQHVDQHENNEAEGERSGRGNWKDSYHQPCNDRKHTRNNKDQDDAKDGHDEHDSISDVKSIAPHQVQRTDQSDSKQDEQLLFLELS